MTLNLKNKKVLITGASSGIGLEIAKKFYTHGCLVAINSRNQKSLDLALKNFNNSIEIIKGDVSLEKDAKKVINEFINRFKTIDILICNVGSGRSAKPLDESIFDWERSFSINLLTSTNTISAALEHLSKTSGVITCISSICSSSMIENAPLTYSSIKAALNRYVINSSFYLAKKKIRINGVSPGNVMFPGSVWEKKRIDDPEGVKKLLREKVPLNKFVTPEDVAEAVAFLSSPLSSSITGQILKVDAGQSVL